MKLVIAEKAIGCDGTGFRAWSQNKKKMATWRETVISFPGA